MVGMKGAVAAKERVVGPTFNQVPGTGGTNVGIADAVSTGADSLTFTTWSEGTLVVPVTGVVATTVRGWTAVVAVAPPAPEWFPLAVVGWCFPSA
jgi:xanthine/uracil permease